VTGTTGKATDASAVLAGFRPGVAVSTGIAAAGFVVALSGVLAPVFARRTVEAVES
jgi:hypothetical protein